MVLKDCDDLGGPLAPIAQIPQFKTTQYPYTIESSYQPSYDTSPQSYEANAELDDEEEFQNVITLVSQQFNKLPPLSFQKNQKFTKPPFNLNFKPQSNHSRYPRKPHHPSQPKNVPPAKGTPQINKSSDLGTTT